MKVQSILIAGIAAIGFSILTPAAAQTNAVPAVLDLVYTADHVSSQVDLYTDVKFRSRRGYHRSFRGNARHSRFNRGFRSSRSSGYYNGYYGQYNSRQGYYDYDRYGSRGVHNERHDSHGGRSFKDDKRIHNSHGVVIKKRAY